MFRVVPDQLRMSSGWVRCGQCQAAFDASAQLQTPSGRSASTAVAAPLPEATPSVQVASQASPALASSADLDEVTAPGHTSAPQPDLVLPAPAELPLPDLPAFEAASHAEPRLDAAPVDLLLDDLTWAEPPPLGVTSATVQTQPQDPVYPDDEEGLRHPPARSVRAASVWRRRLVWLALVVLTLALALQVVRQERDRIVAALPATQNVVQTLCHWTGCEVQLLRQADAIVLDSASFLKVRDGVYRLSLTLRNTARWDLAVPAIELTLTDAEDQALLRRVLPAADLAVPDGRLAAGVETPVSMLLGIEARELSSRVVGYHALAFYP